MGTGNCGSLWEEGFKMALSPKSVQNDTLQKHDDYNEIAENRNTERSCDPSSAKCFSTVP